MRTEPLADKDNELLQKKVSSLEQEILELTASRNVQQTSEWYFIDKLIRTEPKRGQIGLAVVLPALISVVSIVIYLLITQYLGNQERRRCHVQSRVRQRGSCDLGRNLDSTIDTHAKLFFAPLPFGFWVGLALPGNHPKRYVLLGLLVGLLTMIGVIGAHMLADGAAVIFRELAAADLTGWIELLGFSFFGPALFFLSGGLFADAIKTRAYDKSIDLGLPEKMVAKLSGSEQAPSENNPAQRNSLLVQLVGPSIIAFLGTLMRFAGELVKFVETLFSPHLK